MRILPEPAGEPSLSEQVNHLKMKKQFVWMWLGLLAVACSSSQPLPVVEDVDLKRYQGRWYELASFPLRPQKHCTNTYAEYSLKEGEIQVYNHCIDSTNGKVKDISGIAYPESGDSNSRLRVKFFWLFSAPYHIIALDTVDYHYAMVGTPNRKYLWILCRDTQLAPAIMDSLLQRATTLQFDISRLNYTLHRQD